MAKTAMKVKQQRKQKFSTREYSRCKICGRPHAYLRKYGLCRVCFRELAYNGDIPGMKKSSWQEVIKMATSDPIADMLTRIRNANTAKHDTVDMM